MCDAKLRANSNPGSSSQAPLQTSSIPLYLTRVSISGVLSDMEVSRLRELANSARRNAGIANQ